MRRHTQWFTFKIQEPKCLYSSHASSLHDEEEEDDRGGCKEEKVGALLRYPSFSGAILKAFLLKRTPIKVKTQFSRLQELLRSSHYHSAVTQGEREAKGGTDEEEGCI